MSRASRHPMVSVVIPTYNRARDLRRCLDSLNAQSMREFEALVCDDGSTDDTAAVARAYAATLDLTYLPASNWGGAAHPRNRGIAQARASYVAFLDSDDWWATDKLRASVAALKRGADVVYHDMYLATHDAQRLYWRRVRSHSVEPPVYDSLLEMGNVLPLSSVVMRRSLLESIGGMPEDRALIAIEDYACWLEAARVTERFVRIPGTFGYYWAGGGNISGDARTLALLEVFEARYARPAVGGTIPQPIPWVSYARGRALQRLGRYEEAREELARVSLRAGAIALSARALVARAALALQQGATRGR